MSDDIIGLFRAIRPRYSEAGQRAALAAPEIKARCVLDLATTTRAEVVRMARRGTVFAVLHLHLLADPKCKRKKGGMRADLWAVIDALEKRGSVIWELYTGLRTDTKAGRDTMTRGAIETLARGRHKTERSDKRGRPPKDIPEALKAKAKPIWESRKLKRWEDVAAKLPKGITVRDCWKLWGPRNSEN